MGTQQTQSMKRARNSEFMVMRGREVVLGASAILGTADSVEVLAVGGCCDDDSIRVVMLCCCVVRVLEDRDESAASFFLA
jgi:hypothetical protein